MNFKNWDPGFLCDYIVNTHHQYVTKTLPELVFYTEKIAHVHGEHHPELVEVASLFTESNRELLQHLKNEEVICYCKSGQRSAMACLILEHLGFANTANMVGGVTEWKEKFPPQ